jgi:hypothetical protein
MKKFAILLTVIFVTAGSAQARISSSREITFQRRGATDRGEYRKAARLVRSKIN